MEFMSLDFSLNQLASTGVYFSMEHGMALKASLSDLCKQNNFSNVYFWGKIHGTENDYYIVFGVIKNYISGRQYFYSVNHSLDWIQLIEPTPFTKDLALASTGRFVGNPNAICETEISANHEDTVDEEVDEEEESLWITFREEERLSATVAIIQSESEVIPRAAFMRDPMGMIYQNRAFEGLSKDDALNLISYYHVRQPEDPKDKHIVARPDYDVSLDFLNSIANDLPIGCWNISLDNLETVATVKSLYWPGAYGSAVLKNNRQHHMCGWSLFSWWYNGTGKKNWDVPFMISPPPRMAKACVVETIAVPENIENEEEEEIRPYSIRGSKLLIPVASRNNSVKPNSIINTEVFQPLVTG